MLLWLCGPLGPLVPQGSNAAFNAVYTTHLQLLKVLHSNRAHTYIPLYRVELITAPVTANPAPIPISRFSNVAISLRPRVALRMRNTMTFDPDINWLHVTSGHYSDNHLWYSVFSCLCVCVFVVFSNYHDRLRRKMAANWECPSLPMLSFPMKEAGRASFLGIKPVRGGVGGRGGRGGESMYLSTSNYESTLDGFCHKESAFRPFLPLNLAQIRVMLNSPSFGP